MIARVEPKKYLPRSGELCLADGVFDLEESYKAVLNGARFPGVSTGFPSLDKAMGGLQPGALITLMSAPGVGKTRTALHIARQAAMDGFPVVYVTSDEAKSRLALRLACMDAKLELSNTTQGKDPSRLRRYVQDSPEFWKNIDFQEHFNLDLDSLKDYFQAKIEQKKARMGLLIIDYLQPMAATTKAQEMRIAVGKLAETFRNIAISCKSPALVISSVSRSQYKDPTLAAGKESGELEYSADAMLTLVRPDKLQNELRLTIEKNRYGEPFKSIDLVFNPSVGTMSEAESYLRAV
jgi:replicative DNA helicase